MLLDTEFPPETKTGSVPFHGGEVPEILYGAVPPLGIMVMVPSLLFVHVSFV